MKSNPNCLQLNERPKQNTPEWSHVALWEPPIVVWQTASFTVNTQGAFFSRKVTATTDTDVCKLAVYDTRSLCAV